MPEQSVFRKKSVERVSSPEQLNDYIKVASPGMWFILLAAIVFLIGFIIFGASAKLETKVSGAAVVTGSGAGIYVSEENADKIEAGQTVLAEGLEFRIGEIGNREPFEPGPERDSLIIHAGGFEDGEWVYLIPLEPTGAQIGTYRCEIVTDSVSPMSFIIN